MDHSAETAPLEHTLAGFSSSRPTADPHHCAPAAESKPGTLPQEPTMAATVYLCDRCHTWRAAPYCGACQTPCTGQPRTR